MIEFTKREHANEYSVWFTDDDDPVGELWYNEEKGWHFSSFESDMGYHIDSLQEIIDKVRELNYFVKYCEYSNSKRSC